MPDQQTANKGYLESGDEYQSLSVKDLLDARSAYHVFLTRKKNVVGTAIGMFRVRRDTKDPSPKTLENTIINERSRPCIMVFVENWITRENVNAATIYDFLPRQLHLPDGRSVPVCVIQADWHEHETGTIPGMSFPGNAVGPGYPVLTRLQGLERWATFGCLVTDGRTTCGLTNSHVAGNPGEKLYTFKNGKIEEIGHSSANLIRKAPFEKVYEGLPGMHTLVNMDVGLIEFNDMNGITSRIYGLGPVRGLVDVNHDTLSMKLIGCRVAGYGCSSGIMQGEIIGLFYRYAASGGYDYVSDYLIGPRFNEKGQEAPFDPREGDSGALLVIDDPGSEDDRKAIGLLWGGQKDTSGGKKQPYGLATNLGTICRELDVELVCDWNTTYKPYFGAYAHVTLPSLSIDLIKNKKLKQLLDNNKEYFCMPLAGTTVEATSGLSKKEFVPLSDVPDLVWKSRGPYPRGKEGPNHFANMDQKDPLNGNKTLLDLCADPANIEPSVWLKHYDDIHETARGALPFRIAQVYDAMVKACQEGKAADFVGAAGILTHYVMDAAQPMHISFMHDGDPSGPTRKEKGKDVLMASGVHEELDNYIVEKKHEELVLTVGTLIQQADAANLPVALKEIKTARQAARAACLLMGDTLKNASPAGIVKDFEKMVYDKPQPRCDKLWTAYGAGIKQSMAEAVVLIARLWEAAWTSGKGSTRIKSSAELSTDSLKELYKGIATQKNGFLDSVNLKEIAAKMRW